MYCPNLAQFFDENYYVGTVCAPVAYLLCSNRNVKNYRYNTFFITEYFASEGSGLREKVSNVIPKFLTPSKSLIFNKGTTVKLSCDVDDLGKLSI
jgi:hypothetical protein